MWVKLVGMDVTCYARTVHRARVVTGGHSDTCIIGNCVESTHGKIEKTIACKSTRALIAFLFSGIGRQACTCTR